MPAKTKITPAQHSKVSLAIIHAVKLAAPNGLRIGELVKTSRYKRSVVARVLRTLRKERVLKMKGVRRAARYTPGAKIAAKRAKA